MSAGSGGAGSAAASASAMRAGWNTVHLLRLAGPYGRRASPNVARRSGLISFMTKDALLPSERQFSSVQLFHGPSMWSLVPAPSLRYARC